eukprot:m.162833 g.162833  ORF g.162833 m.162833 type:complete len:85 (+) comp31278_c1_seq45:1506-1760(+)
MRAGDNPDLLLTTIAVVVVSRVILWETMLLMKRWTEGRRVMILMERWDEVDDTNFVVNDDTGGDAGGDVEGRDGHVHVVEGLVR